MSNNKFLPTSFSKKYIIKEKIDSLNEIARRKLTRFPYRYRFAKSFSQIEADTAIRTRTLIGYEAGMKVFLAYTCYEQIVYVANSLKIDGVNAKAFNEVLNDEITTSLHNNKSFMKMIKEAYDMGITEEIENEKQRNTTILSNSLDKFLNDKSSDVLCLAYAIRNLYAHGEFTGGGSGVTNNKTRDLFYKIADEVLDYSNNLYSECIKKLGLMK